MDAHIEQMTALTCLILLEKRRRTRTPMPQLPDMGQLQRLRLSVVSVAATSPCLSSLVAL